ncbi:hypothetical protein PybrP1_002201 [[Pythium] brassicae (nom. inval.)]|nr:hypothetical protein PybrP1_002201 [[Pythium] brassicae (nom. inval.)]
MPTVFSFHFRSSSDKHLAAAADVNPHSHEVLSGSDEIVEKCRSVLRLMQSYQGCLPLIQRRELLAALAPNIDVIRVAYELALQVESRSIMAPTMEKLANLLEFVMCFDKIKSFKPEIQNDLSYFRRLAAVSATVNQLERFTDAPLDALSLFVAEHCPMLKPKDPRVVVHHLRVMTGAILLYDHSSRDGAFCSKSDIKIKRCLNEIVEWKHRESLGMAPEQLLDAINVRYVIDTDAGVDDAVAILLALRTLPRDSVLGFTTVFGNVSLAQANHNVAHILEACGRVDVPVHSGAAKAIVGSVSDERWGGHGPDGLGGASGASPSSSSSLLAAARRNDAVHTLVELAQQHRGELVVIALGPLTNVALATLIDPSFVANVKQVVVMGGTSRGEGNLTKHAEFNAGCDPEATSIVLEHSGAADKVLVLPIETCTDHELSWRVFDDVFPEHSPSASAQYVRRIWGFTRAFAPNEGFVPCDAYAVALLLHPQYVKTARAVRGSVHLAPDEYRGASLWTEVAAASDSGGGGQEQQEGGVEPNGKKTQANATLVMEIDERVFVELLRGLVQ